MNNIVLIFTLALVVYMTISNYKTFKKYKQNKDYVECFNKFKEQENDSYDYVNEYISKEKSEDLKNKAKFFKLYIELDIYPEKAEETLDDIDFNAIILKNNKFDIKNVLMNSDVFVWVIMCMARAKRIDRKDLTDKLFIKECEHQEELGVLVEYQLCAAVYKAVKSIEDKGVDFFNMLLNGEYAKLYYEKRFIGIYKRFAACTLVYLAENISEYDKEDLKIFTESYIGKQYMIELGLYDSYKKTFEDIDLKDDSKDQ